MSSNRVGLGTSLWSAQAHMPSVLDSRVTLVAGDGAYLTTSDGARLLDATAGLWHANVGHGRESIARAAYEQMCRLETYHVFGRFANEPALQLADRVTAMGPIPDAKVFWTSGGSDAVDLACKLARRHWQLENRPDKRIILSRANAYHGLHGFGTSIAGLEYNRDGYGSDSLIPETARIPTNDLAGVAAVIAELGPERIAAIVAEPVMGTGGVIPPEPGYLDGLQRLARANDILFIVDEVITGFGRTGVMFASERFGLQPDMVLMAKGITSGYAPLGGVLIAPAVWGRFFADADAPMFRHGLTYSGHATACAVAATNLDILEQEGLVERAAELEGVLARAVKPLADHELVADVRSAGFMAGVQLLPEVPGEAIADACIAGGVVMRAINNNTLQICPPFVVTDEEVSRIAATIQDALDGFASRR
ncbi:aspartate aminotransferase family protein [Planosporangium flavigriseum]|uniref:Aspartate aminotransferase family protein n=1 Tax=Planosporangium flavigriseum TaxID=373681 RepID=A0A8J3LYT5_9ACTN|nr:aminotransferase class III-fold pyridoxal phosphate-dependent enzyme [Planosporangium flavigriseum]NJC67719.1 aspartate aminotransferase family protein [Planosporangium flavigriseum]GIG75996.1 aspartate aminotransferase family protein [Planosporangium flavigriseum]